MNIYDKLDKVNRKIKHIYIDLLVFDVLLAVAPFILLNYEMIQLSNFAMAVFCAWIFFNVKKGVINPFKRYLSSSYSKNEEKK